MYLTVKQQLKHLTSDEYEILRELCRLSKNLMNEALYINRQYYFKENKYIGFNETYEILKNSENYKILNSHMAQQILKIVDSMFSSFIGLLKLIKKKELNNKNVKLPGYLPKDGFATLYVQDFTIKNQTFTLPYSHKYSKTHKKIKIKVPSILDGKIVKFIRIVPKYDAKFFEIQYIYEVTEDQREFDDQKALAIDFGVNNLMTCVTNEGSSFIIDGRKLKSVNQWYNKEIARLSSIKDRQKIKDFTVRQKIITMKRNRRVNDYISKACRMVIRYCIENNIGILVCGYNKDFQSKLRMNKETKQNFINIPFGKIRKKFEYLCKLYGIEFVEQEESYTSKASFWDKDEMPVYNYEDKGEYNFSGKRVSRGLYRTSSGFKFNADVNGALNILRKSRVVSLMGLYSRGDLCTPLRIRVPS